LVQNYNHTNTTNSGSKQMSGKPGLLKSHLCFKESAIRNYQHLSDFPGNV